MCRVARAFARGATLLIGWVTSCDTDILIQLAFFSGGKTLRIYILIAKTVRDLITIFLKPNITKGTLFRFGAAIIGKWVTFTEADAHVCNTQSNETRLVARAV